MLSNSTCGKRERCVVCKRNQGSSLIEVLVSIVIASIGLLALAGVNASSIRYTKMSQYRGTATQLAGDIAERMRANKVGAASYDFQADFTAQQTLPAAVSPLCNSYATTCTAGEVAAFDLQTWRVIVRNQLPEGSAFIIYHGPPVGAADVWIAWRDPAVADDDAATTGAECPGSLSATAGVRCSYFRINL